MRKRCWKTVLSAILASAMLFTSVPTNLTMTVHAEELGVEDTLDDVNETEDVDEQENEALTGNEAGEEENAQNPVGGGTKVVTTTEDEEPSDGGDGADVGTSAVTGHVVNADKTVTFTCVASELTFKDGNNQDAEVATADLTGVFVKSAANNWGGQENPFVELQKGDNNVWTGTSKAVDDPGSYEYCFAGRIASGSTNVYVAGRPNGTFIIPGGIEYQSPVVEGKNVTFKYNAAAGFSSKVWLAGDMNGWQNGAQELTKNSETGLYELTIEMKPGVYGYKFILGASATATGVEWKNDPVNTQTLPNGNSKVVVAGLGDATIQAKANGTTNLPVEIETYYSESGEVSSKEVTYTLSSETPAGITLGINGDQQTVTVPSTLSAGEEFELTATNKDDTSETCTVTVELVSIMPDASVKSPVVGKGEATFYFYAPKPATQLVKIKGDMTGWEAGMKELDYNEDTGYWSITLKNMAIGEYGYGFEVFAEGADTTETGEWSLDKLNPDKNDKGNSLVKITEAADVIEKSPYPIVNGKTVKFVFDPSLYVGIDPTAITAAYMAAEISGWGDTVKSDEYKMTKNEETGQWELTKEMPAGSYTYKYIYLLEGDSESHWEIDKLNTYMLSGGNSVFYVAGLADLAREVERSGKKTELDAKLKLYDEVGNSEEVAVTYALSEDTEKAPYKDKIELTTEGDKTFVNLKEEFPEEVEAFTLTATDAASNNTSTVKVSVVDKTYKYTIYYYDAEHYNEEKPKESAALWIYSDGVNGTLYNFDETEEISGSTWLKAEVDLSFTKLSIIPRNAIPADSWVWQDETRTYDNEKPEDAVNLYIVFDDGHRIYTELPQNVNFAKRYLVAEYERTDAIADWYLYTWNNGYGDTYAPFNPTPETDTLNGLAQVRVRRGLESLSFCIAEITGVDQSESNWKRKDGGDYRVDVPEDQTVVKIQIKQGKGVVKTYPYNIGYELAPADQKIHFYYRDDAAFLEGSESGHETVVLEVGTPGDNGQVSFETKTMNYNTDEQRYCLDYDLDVTKAATYYYRYYIDSETYVTDDFNDKKETIEEKEYSVLNYDKIDAEMVAKFQNDTMDYNDNNVLSIKVDAKDSEGKPIEDTEELNVVKKATVDLSALGGSETTEIDPELLAISVAVKQSTSAGVKTLPITIEDIYGNEHKTDAKVTVVDRNKGSDFDWDEAVVYFAVTDRFFDGNAANNEGDAPGSYDKTTNGGLNSSYHGGDFAGLTQKLDYLQELGVNTIWITPIVENQTVENSVDDPTVKKAWGYTGYWAKDFTKLDSHLGTEAEFSALLNAAHAKGMKVMVDVVLNHTGYGDEITNKFNNYTNKDGEVIRMLRSDEEVINGHDQKSSLSGLPDFLTEDPEVRDLVVEWQSNWISKYPIDYYRVDTVKHVDNTTWSAFKNALTEINPDFKMIGEWAGAGYATDTGMLDTGRMDALLDFDFPKEAADFVAGDLSGVEGFLSARNGAIDNTASLGSWLSNHDQQGFVKRLMKEKGKSEEESKQLALVAASLQLTAKGQVYIYYGEEIGVSDGEENYPYQSNRRDFDWSKVTDDNEALAHYKKMISIRNMYSELFAKGARNTVSTDNGLDVFTRSYGGTTLTVALNITNQAQTYTLSGQTPGKVMLDYYSGALFPIDENGNAVITVPAAADGGTVVLVQDEELENHPEGMQIRKIPDQTYTGLSIKLPEDALQVYAGTNRLKAGVDYTVSYKNNKAVGTATVTIKGKGNYKDSVTAQFNIVPKNIAADDVVITYNEYVKAGTKEQKPLSKITYNGKKLTTKEYQVKYYKKNDSTPLTGVKEAGEYQMEITATGKNYTGVAKKTIHVVNGTFMNELKITFGSTSVTYAKTSEELETKLGVEVKDGEAVLEKGKDYEVSFPDGIEVGTAKITITAINKGADQKYYGSVTKTFKINGEPLNSVAKVNPTGWVNVPIDPVSGKAEQAAGVAVLVKKNNNSTELTLGDDYTVSYSNNTKPGTATVTFTGKGKYTGTLKKTFKVTAIAWKADDLGKDLKVTMSETAPFSKKGAQPAVTVTYSGKKLTEGKDYKVTYNNNKVITPDPVAANKKPSVTITGMGMFSGTIKNAAEFTVVRANLETAGITVTAPDVELASGYESKPVVKAADGMYLIKDTDYTVEYHELDENGKPKPTAVEAGFVPSTKTRMQVTVTGEGNYTGSVSKEYRIVGTSISKATIIAKAQTYTGKAITLDANDFSKARIGKQNLTYGTDYVIVPGSYEKNVNKGNATVTVKGIGNYGGEKKVTFRITSAGMRWWWNLFS